MHHLTSPNHERGVLREDRFYIARQVTTGCLSVTVRASTGPAWGGVIRLPRWPCSLVFEQPVARRVTCVCIEQESAVIARAPVATMGCGSSRHARVAEAPTSTQAEQSAPDSDMSEIESTTSNGSGKSYTIVSWARTSTNQDPGSGSSNENQN